MWWPGAGSTPAIHESARRARARLTTARLVAQPAGAFRGGERRPRRPGTHLVPLAPAPSRIAARAEDGLEILPKRFVGRDDRDLRRRRRLVHADILSKDEAGRVLPSGSAKQGR